MYSFRSNSVSARQNGKLSGDNAAVQKKNSEIRMNASKSLLPQLLEDKGTISPKINLSTKQLGSSLNSVNNSTMQNVSMNTGNEMQYSRKNFALHVKKW